MVRNILSIYMILYLVLLGFVPARTARAQEREHYTIAVLNLNPSGVSEVEAEVLSEKLRSHIAQVITSDRYGERDDLPAYQMVERENVEKIFEQFEIQNVGCVSDSCAIEFGRMLQVDRIVFGTIGLVGSTYSVAARITDVESSRTINVADGQLRGSIDDVMSELMVEVGDELMYGEEEKSRLKWYLLAGAVIAAGAGAALLGGGGDDGGGSGGPVLLPLPPDRPD